MKPDKEKEFLANVQQTLDEGLQSIDGDTRLRIQHLRGKVLSSKSGWRTFLIPATAFASFATVTLVVSLNLTGPANIATGLPTIDEMPLVAMQEDLELLEQLEFYEWLVSDVQQG